MSTTSDVTGLALASVWAKTYWDDEARVGYWLPLWQHLDDCGGVAGRLWDQWLPPSARDTLSGAFGGPDQARRAVCFLAGVHDVGKATPAFAVQARRGFGVLADDMRAVGLVMPAEIPDVERRKLHHTLAGQVALEDWLVERAGWALTATSPFAVVVGGHHGIPPDVSEPGPARTRQHLLGGGLWHDVRFALLDRAARRFAVDGLLAEWGSLRLSQPVQVLLTGLVVVADWIASNADLFPSVPLEGWLGGDPAAGHDRLEQGWAELALPRPWRPVPGDSTVTQRLHARFDVPASAEARPVQEAAVTAANVMDLPGILVIEAPMGEGKTEAALLAAEILAARSGAGGCFVALPTQATTDAMFARVVDWLSCLPDAADGASGTAHSVALSHGKAWLSDGFRELRFRRGLRFPRAPVGVAQDEPGTGKDRVESVEAFVHGWTNGRKRASLADFVVGTIDQLLFTALKARHVVLRHLGMARKVVVIDEVHAYDAYMGSYLLRALEWLGAYGTPVVLLSATLPRARREEFFDAYARGRSSLQAREAGSLKARLAASRLAASRSAVAPAAVSSPAGCRAERSREVIYPAVSYRWRGELVPEQVAASGRHTPVELELLDDDPDTLLNLLEQRLAGGGCALVVRNTVKRAQETADHLAAHFGGDVRVVHSRFIGHDRVRNDEWLRTTFGSPRERAGEPARRPGRFVVVGTQVVEQSLDIDFDLLVTDLAPIDLLLQRIGRLHRHERGVGQEHRPELVRVARCVVTGVTSWKAEPPELLPGSVGIYWRYPLYRAAALIGERVGDGRGIVLPDDIATLVEVAYGDAVVGPPSWQPVMASALEEAQRKARDKRSAAEVFQVLPPQPPGNDLLGWLHADIGEADEDRRGRGRAQVRDGDDSVEVLLLRPLPDGSLRLPTGSFRHAGEVVPTDRKPSDSVARAIAGCALRLPASATRGERGDALIAELEQLSWFRAWQTSPALRGQLVLGVSEAGGTTVAGQHFSYDSVRGLEVT